LGVLLGVEMLDNF